MRTIGVLLGILYLSTACSRSALSERDAKLEQIRSNAETKRQELLSVSGDYSGNLKDPSGNTQIGQLHLEVKDVPMAVEGQVDPVLVPTLSGQLSFPLTGMEGAERISFSIQKSEYNPGEKKLDLVVSNSELKDIFLGLRLSGDILSGNWNATSLGSGGQAALTRNLGISPLNPDLTLAGDYGGILFDKNLGTYQYGKLTLITSTQAPDSVKVSANLRLIYGPYDSTEYLSYSFDRVQFNPLTGQIVLKNETANVGFTGFWSQGKLQGQWFSNDVGLMGNGKFQKNDPPESPAGKPLGTLKGSYEGRIKNNTPEGNIPERVLISFVTGQDSSAAGKIKVTGNLRFFYGEGPEAEFYEVPFSEVQYNFFTHQLTARNTEDYRMTLKGFVGPNGIEGTVHTDAQDEVGKFKVVKQ